jgi:hypothetical protein
MKILQPVWQFFWIGAVTVTSLTAQSPEDRRFLDSVFFLSRHASNPAGVPDPSICVARPADVARICQGAIELGRGTLSNRRSALIAANDLAVRAVVDQDKWPEAWILLGLVRVRWAHDTIFAQDGPGMPAGMSTALGAANALAEALRLDPTFTAAAEELAFVPEPREGAAALIGRVRILRGVRQMLSPRALAATAILERDVGSPDSAVALEKRALERGHIDSGVVLLSLARDLYRIGFPQEGRATFIRGASIATDATDRAYRDELAWVASPSELAQWDMASVASRPAWVATFWARRDAADGRPDGARLIEHYHRIEYAMAHFRLALPQVGKQRFLTWAQTSEYAAEARGRDYALKHPDLCPEAARFANDAKTLGADSPFAYYQSVQDLVDDRGVIWIRHGPPTATRQSVGDEIEVWRYDLHNGPLVLQFRAADFRGISGASVLVPSLLTLPEGERNQVCELDSSLCGQLGLHRALEPSDTMLIQPPVTGGCTGGGCPQPVDPVTGRPLQTSRTFFKPLGGARELCRDPLARVIEREVDHEGARLDAGAIVRARARGREMIDLATTTDSYQRDFAKAIHPAVQVYGLDRAQGGSPRLVIAFALPGQELAYTKLDSAGRRAVYPVEIQVMTVDAGSGARHDVDTLRRFVSPEPVTSGKFITGVLEVPMTPGRYATSVVFTQSDGHGAMSYLSEIVVPGVSSLVSVSDLVLGRENSGVRWNSGATSVALNPLNAYAVGANAEVYFQLSGMTVGTKYQTKYEFFRSDDDPKRGPRLSVASSDVAVQGRTEVSRTLGLQQLDPGKYRVKLTISGDGAMTMATGWLTIVR